MASQQNQPLCIYFRLSGNELERVIRWQQATDLEVMRYQLEAFGSTTVICYKHNPHRFLQHLQELPQPGEAIPWYGDTSDLSYAFTFRPNGNAGNHLTVVSLSGGSGYKQFPPEKVPPLEIDIPNRIQIEPVQPQNPSSHRYGPGWGWWCDWTPEHGAEEIVFDIGDYLWQKLSKSRWTPATAEEYGYMFNLSSTGTHITLQMNGGGDTLWLTEGIEG